MTTQASGANDTSSRDKHKPYSWRNARELLIMLTDTTAPIRLIWLVSLRIAVGCCDLLLAGTMYLVFLYLQGRAPSHFIPFAPRTISTAALSAVVLIILRCCLELFSLRSIVRYVQSIQTELTLRLTRGYTEMEWSHFTERNRSEMLNYAIHLPRDAAFFFHLCIELIASGIVVTMMLCALVYQSMSATGWLILCVAIFYLIHRFSIREILRKASITKEKALRAMHRSIADLFASGREIRTYANQLFFYDKVVQTTSSVSSENLRLMVLPQFAKTLSDQGVVLIFLSLIMVAQWNNGDIRRTLSLLVFYFVLSRRLLPLISQIAFMASQMEESGEAVRTAHRELLECIQHRTRWQPTQSPSPGFVLELRDLSFAYTKDKPVLRNVYLRQRPGEILVLQGVSGTGKSSLLNIIAGMLQPCAGYVDVDRKRIAYVPQEVGLLDDSVRNNLLFGISSKGDIDLMHALAVAGLDHFITTLPMGLDTRVGDNGILFSGGQRQRLGLARALLRESTLLLLDEATSALDPESEDGVLRNIRAYGCAVLLVTHRLQTQRFGDRILLLHEGRLIERTEAPLLEFNRWNTSSAY